MKIALFTDSFLPGIGGTENAVYRLALELCKEHEVMVCAPKYNGKHDDNFYPFKVVRAKSVKVTGNDYWALPSITPKMKKALDEFAPDVLHTHTLGMMSGYANGYGRQNGIPIIHTLHTKYRYCYRHALKSKLLAEMLVKYVSRRANAADKLITVSASMIEEARSYGIKGEFTVIKNGVYVRGERTSKTVRDGEFKFLYVGLISSIKNLKVIFDGLKIVLNTSIDFSLRLVGRGPDIKKFKRYAKKIGILDKVSFEGPVRDREVLDGYYREADLFLFPSVFDSDGLTVLEAKHCGTPSLVYEGTGASERILDGENGFTSKRAVEEYADKILELMEDRRRLVKAGNSDKIMYGDWEESAREYVRVYKRLIEEYAEKSKQKLKQKGYQGDEAYEDL